MASKHTLRRDARPAKAGRGSLLQVLALPLAFTAAAVVVATAVLATAHVAGMQGEDASPTPAFLQEALGSPQRSASLVRRPAPGVEVRITNSGYEVEHGGATASLAALDRGRSRWQRFEGGATRPTRFGSETITIEPGKVEEYLTVTKTQGSKLWRWKLATSARPELAADGGIDFVVAEARPDGHGHRHGALFADFRILPVELLDSRGRQITPAGLRWSLQQEGPSWWVELRLDDTGLPRPYVIDPAIAFRAASQAANGGETSLAIGTPAGVAVNDVMVAQVTVRGGTGTTISAPGGWTEIRRDNNGTNLGQALYYKVAGASEPASYTWTFNVGTRASGGIMAYSNVNTANPIQASSGGTGTGAAVTAPSVTTTVANTMVLGFFGVNNCDNGGDYWTPPGGTTERIDINSTGSFPLRSNSEGVDFVQGTAGATGGKTSTPRSSGSWIGQLVALQPLPPDGNGTLTTTTTNVAASSTGNTVAFTYTAGSQGMVDGAVTLDVPTGWSAPSITGSSAGYTTASTGTVSVSAQKITVSGVTLGAAGTMTITYGSTASGGPGAVATSTTGGQTWQAQQKGASAGTLTNLASSPSLTVNAPNGSGTLTTPTTNVGWGSRGNTITFTYTAATGGISNGAVSIDVPSGWSAPSTTGTAAGYSTASVGTLSAAGQTITVSGLTLASGAGFTITYGSTAGGGLGATAPSNAGSQTWQGKSKSVLAGTLTNLASSPSITVNARPSAPSSIATTPPSPANDISPEVTGAAPTGTTVKIYTSADCSGPVAASGTDAAFASPGLTVAVTDNATTNLSATAMDSLGGISACSASIAYTADSVAPAAPSGLGTNPASPANNNDPKVTGSAEAGTTVNVYASSDCSGAIAGSGDAADFGAGGLDVPNVADDSSTAYSAKAVDPATNASLCSGPVTYVEDSTGPGAPSGLATNPASPANDNDPEISGTAEAGSTVQLYTTSDCTGAPVATGSAATFTGAGLSVNVAANSSTTFRATATDQAGNASACSTSSVTYVEDSVEPSAGFDFPADASTYDAAGWNAGCAPSGLCGTASDTGGSGLLKVEVSIKRDSTGLYWDGDGFDSASEDWRLAAGTASWALGFAASNLSADGGYTVRVRAADDAGNIQSTPAARTFTYATDSTAPSSTVTFPSGGMTYTGATWNAGCAASGICGTAVDETGGSGLQKVEVSLQRTSTGLYWDGDSFDSLTEDWRLAVGTATWSLVFPASSFPANGDYTIRVRATDDANNSEVPSSRTITFDGTAPSSIVDFPVGGATYTAAVWNAGCTPSGLCGTASDTGSGVAQVEVSLERESDGLYWDGVGFDAAGETWLAASGAATWSYAFAASGFPADGDYTLRLRAADSAGNQESPSSRTFTIDTTAPNTQIDSLPPDLTNSQNATFTFSAGEAATFECRLDDEPWSSCTSPEDYSSLGEGSHSFRVRATDAAGNLDATPALHSWTIDITDPTAAFDFPADATAYNVSSWNAGCSPNGLCGTASDAGGAGLQNVQVSIRRGSDGKYWDGSAFSAASEDWQDAAGTSSWSLDFPASNFPADESYSVRARANDSAGNVSAPVARTFTIDGVPPQTAIDSDPANPSNSDSADFSFSSNEPASTFECRLDEGAWAACTSPESYSGLAQGSHSFDVRAADVSGNVDPTPASSAWVVDTVAPTGSLDNPGPYLRGTVTITADASDTGGTGVASVTFQRAPAGSGTWTPLGTDTSTPYSFDWDTTSASDDLYDLRVVIVDNATNSTSTLAATNVRVDNTPPAAVMDSPGENVAGTVTLTHSSTDDGSGIAPASVQFEYRSSPAGAWTPTGPSWDTAEMEDGLYDLRVSVADRAGNTDISAEETTRVDNTPPEVSLVSPTDGGYVNASSADPRTIVAAADDDGSGVDTVAFFACSDASLDCSTGMWTTLGAADGSAPYEGSWPLPVDGNRALKATATDNAAHAASAVINVTVDRTVPDTTITVQPGDPSNVAAPSFEFESNEAEATFECQIDAAGWSSCASPHILAALGDGTHTFEVRAVDLAANADASPATKTWLVDTTPPNATMNDPGATLRQTVALTSVADDPGASASGIAAIDYEYSADGGTSWFPTPAAWDTTLVSDGLYAVRVVVSDNAGNVTESAPVTDRLVDNTPPATSIDDPGANLRQTITLIGSATDEGSGVLEVDFQYMPSGGSTWTTISTDNGAPYEASLDTTSLADGVYDFRTVARDVAGNQTEGTPVLGRRIDNTPPTATMNDPGANLRGTVTLTSVADDTGGSGVSSVVYEVSAGGGSWTPISATWDTNSVADGVYDLHVVVRDAAGNETVSLPVSGRRVDNTPPSTSDNAPGGWQNSAVTVTLSADDGGGSGVANTQFSVDGGSYSSGTSVTIPAPSDGSNDGIHSISYFSTDAAGNVESAKTASVAIDATPPAPGANDPGTYLSGTVTLSASPSDPNGIESVEFQYSDGSDWTTIGAAVEDPYSVQWDTTGVSDGSYDLRVIVLDGAGNESTEDLPNKIVDNTPPTAGVGSPTAGATVSGSVSIGATALDANPITSVEFFVRGNSIGSATEPPFTRSWDSTGGPDGETSIYVVVTDIAGHTTTSDAISVTVDNFAPTVTLANPGPNGRGVVALSASADGDAVQVSFERRPAGGSGGWTTIATDTGAPWEASFDTTLVADGMYELRAIAVDGGSNSGTSGVHTVRVDNTLPSGSITAPAGGSTVGGSAVPVSANASDSGSGVTIVTWEYRPAGGGGYAYSASDSDAPYEATWNPSALASGDYEIRVVVRDTAGNEFAGAPITVTVDTDAPTVTLDDPGSPLAGTVTLSAAATGATTVTFAYSPAGANSWTNIGADTSAPWSRDFNTVPRPDALYDLRATASDGVGNSASHTRSGIRLDNRAPSIIASVPADNSIVASASSIELTASEEIDGLADVTLNGDPTVPPIVSGSQATFNTGDLPDGGHTLRGTVRDRAGRTGSFSIFFTVGVPQPSESEPSTETPPTGTPPVGTPAAAIVCLQPYDFTGKVGVDGTLTLRWKAGRTTEGKPCDTIVYADGVAILSFPANQTSANLGPFGSDDLRVFSLRAVGAGEPSQQTSGLRALPPIYGHTLAEATQMLAERGFEVGTVTGTGAVVVPAGVVLAPVRSLIELVLAEPESKLIFQVVGSKRFAWSKAQHLAARIKTTKRVRVTVSLLSPRGERLYRWRISARAGASIVKMRMPRQVRRTGVYRLVFAATAGSDTVRRTIRFRLIGPRLPRPVRPGSHPVDIVLAGGPPSGEVALGLDTPKTRVLEGNSDSTFDLAGDARRNVEVIVVDVDRYGIGLVRDLHTVFPMVRILALSDDPRKLTQSLKAGATVALSKSTPTPKLVQAIRRLAYRP